MSENERVIAAVVMCSLIEKKKQEILEKKRTKRRLENQNLSKTDDEEVHAK